MANYDLTYEGSRVQGILDTGDELRDAGYIFRGEATPSTVPGTPTERVAYIGGPGTYTNFGSSTVVPMGGIGVFKYNGTGWNNYAIIPGIGDGGVFDLSAYNAQGSTLATYADLSAALTALNSVPANYKKGGMTMKFVLTVSGIYVQYRLQSADFNINPANWVNVNIDIANEKTAREEADASLQSQINNEIAARRSADATLQNDIDEFEDTIRTQIDEYRPIEITGDVTNAPDEEDLTSVDQGGTYVLKFKDRNNLNGMGMIIMRRDKTFSEQLTQTNTIYVIRYDFELDADVTIPANCILDFDGGSISGEHTITGQNTDIEATLVKIFGSDIIISGSWKISCIFDTWFEMNNASAFKNCINLCNVNFDNEVFYNKDYTFTTVVTQDTSIPFISIPSRTKVHINGTLQVSVGPDVERYKFIQVSGNNVTIDGSGTLVGDRDIVTPSKTDLPTDHTYEWLHGIAITSGLSNVTIKGLKITKFRGDGIWQGDAGEPSQFITIADCNIYECRRQGITIENACNVWIENNHIHEISGKNPRSAIDLEPSLESQEVKDVTIIGNKIENCERGFITYASSNTLNVKDIRFVKNVICINDANLRTTSPIMACYYTYDCCIDSNHIYTTQGTTTSSECVLWGCKNISFINNKWEINGTLYDISNRLIQILTSAEGIIITGNVFKVASTNPLMWLAFQSTFSYPDVIIKDNNYKDINASNPLPEIIGAEIYDATNKKPLWWNGSAWVDATGATV